VNVDELKTGSLDAIADRFGLSGKAVNDFRFLGGNIQQDQIRVAGLAQEFERALVSAQSDSTRGARFRTRLERLAEEGTFAPGPTDRLDKQGRPITESVDEVNQRIREEFSKVFGKNGLMVELALQAPTVVQTAIRKVLAEGSSADLTKVFEDLLGVTGKAEQVAQILNERRATEITLLERQAAAHAQIATAQEKRIALEQQLINRQVTFADAMVDVDVALGRVDETTALLIKSANAAGANQGRVIPTLKDIQGQTQSLRELQFARENLERVNRDGGGFDDLTLGTVVTLAQQGIQT
jgi:hypothetical protein